MFGYRLFGVPMHNHFLFAGNVLAHFVASMSGIASFMFAMYEHVRNKKIESRIFFGVGILCLVPANGYGRDQTRWVGA
jgi:hypothetical protein